jgi:hypothetical protein
VTCVRGIFGVNKCFYGSWILDSDEVNNIPCTLG